MGVVGYYTEDKCNEIDPNDMRERSEISEGIVNIMQAYFDDVNGGVPTLYSPHFRHREGAI